jgi:hypothetical protein
MFPASGKQTAKAHCTATAASVAFPPLSNISAPILAATGCAQATPAFKESRLLSTLTDDFDSELLEG